MQFCKIAERSGIQEPSVKKFVLQVLKTHPICTLSENDEKRKTCRFLLSDPISTLVLADNGRKIIGKRYISDADASKSGACKACLEYAGRVFRWPEEKDKMPVLPRHQNCKCRYEDVYEKGIDLFFRVKGSPGKYGLFGGGIEFDGIEDLIFYLEKNNYRPHSIDELVISNHSGLDNSYPMGQADNLRFITDKQLQRIKFFLHKKSIVDIRMCSAASGEDGKKTAQMIANKLGCNVIAYAGPVSTSGTRALILPKVTDLPITKRILPDHKPYVFLPQVDKL